MRVKADLYSAGNKLDTFGSNATPTDMLMDVGSVFSVAEYITQPYESTLRPTIPEPGVWKFTLPALASPQTPRRNMIHWAVDDIPTHYVHGDVVIYEAEISGYLGAAAHEPGQWHVLWQAQGPGPNNTWPGPPFGIKINGDDGMLAVAGGGAHPNNTYDSSGYHGWQVNIAPWFDEKIYRVRVEGLIANGTDARLNVWLDGQQIVNGYIPRGYWPHGGGVLTNNYPGLIFPPSGVDYAYVRSDSALYRGSNNGSIPPTYEQWSRTKPLFIS